MYLTPQQAHVVDALTDMWERTDHVLCRVNGVHEYADLLAVMWQLEDLGVMQCRRIEGDDDGCDDELRLSPLWLEQKRTHTSMPTSTDWDDVPYYVTFGRLSELLDAGRIEVRVTGDPTSRAYVNDEGDTVMRGARFVMQWRLRA